ncbi:MAG: helix-turn-helix transcriptional regulator [Candidatus Nanopelagicales bacterium]|nr:helix-turn-helix transcriptional regulator [Candidatus Nanopelagicales bacterium]
MRGRRSLTLATVAEATGTSKSTLSHLEREGAAQAEL